MIIWQRQRWALHMQFFSHIHTHGHTHANNANTSSIHTFNTFGIMFVWCMVHSSFAELDGTSEFIKLHLSPDQPYFRISTDGDAGTSQVECPKESDVVESFSCNQQLINRYRFNLLKPSEKALTLSKKISVCAACSAIGLGIRFPGVPPPLLLSLSSAGSTRSLTADG